MKNQCLFGYVCMCTSKHAIHQSYDRNETLFFNCIWQQFLANQYFIGTFEGWRHKAPVPSEVFPRVLQHNWPGKSNEKHPASINHRQQLHGTSTVEVLWIHNLCEFFNPFVETLKKLEQPLFPHCTTPSPPCGRSLEDQLLDGPKPQTSRDVSGWTGKNAFPTQFVFQQNNRICKLFENVADLKVIWNEHITTNKFTDLPERSVKLHQISKSERVSIHHLVPWLHPTPPCTPPDPCMNTPTSSCRPGGWLQVQPFRCSVYNMYHI